MDMENRVIAITGAGKGLGRAYAHHLASRGASIVVNNRRHDGEQESSADKLVSEIIAAGGKAVAEYSSVEDEDAGKRLLALALEHFGRLDGLVANAGVTESCTFRKQTLASLRQVFEINFMGTVNVVHPIFQHLCVHGGGNIVVSTSSAGLFGEFGLPAYSASKAAVIGLMRSLSLEGRPKSVQVNAIAPYASTQMTADHLSDEKNAALTPERVAPLIAWLLTTGVTGQTLVAGGGRVARAKMSVSAPRVLQDFDESDWTLLSETPTDLEYANSLSHFADFVGDKVQ